MPLCDFEKPKCETDLQCDEPTGNYSIQVTPRTVCSSSESSCVRKCGSGNGGSGNGGSGNGGSGMYFGSGFGYGGGSAGFGNSGGGAGGGSGGFGSVFRNAAGGGSGGGGGGSGSFGFLRVGSTGATFSGSGGTATFNDIAGLENDLMTSMESALQVSVDGSYSRYVYDSSAVPTSGAGSGKVKFVATSPGGSTDTTAASGQTVSVAFDMATGTFTVDPGTGVSLAAVPFQSIMGSSFVSYGTGSVNGSVALRWDASTGRVYVRFYGTNGAITRELDFNMYSIVEGYQGTMTRTNVNNAVNFSNFIQSDGSSYSTAIGFNDFSTGITEGGDSYDYSARYGITDGSHNVTMYVENVPGGDVYNGYANPAVTAPASPATGYILIVLENDNDVANVTGGGDKYELLYNFDTLVSTTYRNGVAYGTTGTILSDGSGPFIYGTTTPTAENFSTSMINFFGSFFIRVNGVGGITTRDFSFNINELLTRTLPQVEVSKYLTATTFVDRTGAAYGTPASIMSYSSTPAALPGTITPTGLANYEYRFDYGVTGHLVKFYVHRGHFAYTGHTTIPAYSPPIAYTPPLVYDPAAPASLDLQDFIDYLLYKEPTPIDPNSAQGKKIVSIATAFYPVVRNTLRSAADGKPYSGSIAHPLGGFRASIQ